MQVDQEIIEQLQNQAANAPGREICGALLGDSGRVNSVVDVANMSTNPARNFLIPASDVLRLERAAEANGQTLLGFYHSHPAGSAVPSAFDLEHALPGYIYLIIAASGRARTWRLRADRSVFDEIEYGEH